MTLHDACDAYLRDIVARNLSESTQNGYRSVFRHLQAFAKEGELTEIDDLDSQQIRTWREGWTVKPSTHETRLKLLSAFFRYAKNEGWIKQSPIINLKPPRQISSPTLPLSRDEMKKMLRAANSLPHERAMLLLMRYSGLAIQDAATISKDAITESLMTLRRAKTGEVVVVDLPQVALNALTAIARPDNPYYFWTGRSKPVTAAKTWRDRLQRVATQAGVKDFRPHRLRDTFAVELLLNGVAMEDVSVLLGHGSISITERYYAPWSKARRDRLVKVVRAANDGDPLLAELNALARGH